MIVSGELSSKTEGSQFLQDLLMSFADEPVVIGPTTPSLSAAHFSASEALAGIKLLPGARRTSSRFRD